MTLLSSLRAATALLHRELDSLLDGGGIAWSRDAYAAYLRGFHAGLDRCWPALDWERLIDLGLPDAEEREARYRALSQDLLALGDSPSPLGKSSHGTPAARMLGCLYVLEGSIHGGALILAGLRRSEPALAERAARFLHGFGERNRARWRDFTDWMGAFPADAEFLRQAADGATTAFHHFLDAFSARNGRAISDTIHD